VATESALSSSFPALFNVWNSSNPRKAPISWPALLRAKLPGHIERPDEVVEYNALGCAKSLPRQEHETVASLRQSRGWE
jgi:hypothetical protein